MSYSSERAPPSGLTWARRAQLAWAFVRNRLRSGPTSGGNARVPVGTAMPVPQSREQWNSLLAGLFGPPTHAVDTSRDRAVAQVYAPPYQGPLELDRYGGETEQSRRRTRDLHSSSPVFRAAVNGQRDDIAVLEPSITSGNKKNRVANDAAEFVKWTVASAPGGWPGLINAMYLPGSLDGYAVLEKKRKLVRWKDGTLKWGLAHVRSLDTCHIRLKLDVYYNVIGVVNMVRGLEYYDPDDYLFYTHNGLFNSPFGQSDGRAAIQAAEQISEVYMLWYVALKVYGLPYMKGKTTAQNRQLMETTLEAMRAGGFAVLTGEKDDIETLDMAVGAAINGFESFIHTRREDIFFAVRNVATPFMEGDGGANAHGDAENEQDASNAGEKYKAHNLVEVIKGQLIPWLVKVNFDLSESEYPTAKLGGTDWNQNAKIIETISKAKEAGLDPSKKWAQDQIAMEGATDAEDRLVSPQEKQQQQQAQQAAQQPQPAVPAPAPAPQAKPADPLASLMSASTFSAEHRPTPAPRDSAQAKQWARELIAEFGRESAA